jgi:signal transduction histidine kinase
VIDHPALQPPSPEGSVSPGAAALSAEILATDISVDAAIERTAAHLLGEPRVDVVMTALTRVAPTDRTRWSRLGGRAWVREWVRPGSGHSFAPPPGAGPEAALSMPWVSEFARTGIVALIDRELLPPEAAQDRAELARFDVASLIVKAYMSDGEMFGSLSAISLEAGPWPDAVIHDIRLLNATIASRLAIKQSHRSLAEAIEAGAEAQRASQQLFGAVGHELRTPLAAILGYTEALLDDAERGSAGDVAMGMKRDGPVIVRSCERMITIVDSLLGAGRAMSMDDERQEVRLVDAVADVVHWHRTPARTAGVDVQAQVGPDLTAWAHPSAVRQVLANLLSNAIAHHRPAGGTVFFSAERLLGESGAEMVRIIVRDDGPGLDADQLEHAFEPFTRFAAPGTTGSGLGLSMSRTIAERDGGAVRGESTPGVGSSFWLELPVRGV